jgi:membrane-associated phospholipid phosphatase
LGEDLAEAFSGTRLLFYAAALAETGPMAFGGGDHAVRVFTQQHLAAPAWGDSANVAGYVLPAVVAPALWLTGLVTGDRYGLRTGSAALQALAVTLATTALLKWTTGRPFPLNGGDPHAPDVLDHPEYAHEFRPFRLDGGWAWPSGHTAASTSVVAALAAVDPDHPVIPAVGYPIAAAIGVGMIVGDRHWTSDVIAGALFGYAIGTSVGGSFRRRALRGPGQERSAGDRDRGVLKTVTLAPLPHPGAVGMVVSGAW